MRFSGEIWLGYLPQMSQVLGAMAERSHVGWTFMSVAWPSNTVEAKAIVTGQLLDNVNRLVNISDTNVQATEIAIHRSKATGGEFRKPTARHQSASN